MSKKPKVKKETDLSVGSLGDDATTSTTPSTTPPSEVIAEQKETKVDPKQPETVEIKLPESKIDKFLAAHPQFARLYVNAKGDWFYTKEKADKNFRSGYTVVENPHHKK